MLFMRNRSLAAVALIVALAAGWTSVAVAFHPAAVRGTNTIVSQGSGRQILDGGGLTYGSLAPGGVVRFVDLSPKHDGKFTVTAQVPATAQGAAAQSVAIRPVRQAGLWVFKLKLNRQNANRSLAFSVAGSKFRLVLEGQSVLNGAGVTGRVTLVGTGTVAINGQAPPLEWASAARLTLPTKVVVPPKPTVPKTTTTATVPTTSTTTATTTTTTTTTA
jgi:hypothetical protein